MEEQHKRHVQREKYAPSTLKSAEAREIQARLQDPLVFQVWQTLERGNSTATFLELYKLVCEGKLKDHTVFVQLCGVLTDQLHRASSDNPHLKKGIRYPRDFLNFMTLMRSNGGQSSQQYSILTSQLGGPTARTLR